MKPEEELILYAVRSKDGKWFRAKGYGGYGETWVDNLQKARIYARPGPARAQVTFFSTHRSKFGTPDLVELRVTDIRICDESERIRKNKEREEKRAARRKMQDIKYEYKQAKEAFEQAQKNLQNSRNNLNALQNMEIKLSQKQLEQK